jgi:hypothetical protein
MTLPGVVSWSTDVVIHMKDAYLEKLLETCVLRRPALYPRSGYVMSCGICGGQIGTGESALRGLRFPLPVLIQPPAPY